MKKSVRLLAFYSVLLIIVILLSSRFIRFSEANLASPFPLKILPGSRLSESLRPILEQSKIKFGIYVKNFKTNEVFKYQESRVFESASLYKIWLMSALYDRIARGELSLEDNLNLSVAEINRRFGIPASEAELTEGYIGYSLKSAIEQMITISHNYAAMGLLTKVPSTEVTSYIRLLGLKNSTMELPLRTTAEDMGLLLEQLYQGAIVSPEASSEMLEVLKRQKLNDRIPKYLPEGTVVAHKTGNLDSFENDAGIIYSPKGDILIVVLTESSAPLEARDEIGKISRTVYDYFTK